MRASDLRIGNLFQDKYSESVFAVESLFRNELKDEIVFDFICCDQWQAEPIPLTEKWLLKFGFNKGEDWGQGQEAVEFKNNNISFWIDRDNEIHLSNQYGLKVKTVHQLQNLYFALTGVELEINTGA